MGGDEVITKSGLMVGLGESFEEMVEAFGILREHRVEVLTVGQYLRPTEKHLPVVRYWHPDEFAALEREAYGLGFESVASGPLVRSSYHADESAREVAARRTYAAARRPRLYGARRSSTVPSGPTATTVGTIAIPYFRASSGRSRTSTVTSVSPPARSRSAHSRHSEQSGWVNST